MAVLAEISGFVTRADAGLVKPRSVSYSITPQNGGCVPHWGGIVATIVSHADCIRTWKAWQTYHMKFHGWADLAYTGGYCQHGYAFAGRGLGVRTAANGTNEGNQNWYAFVWIGGKGMKPTRKAKRALRWWIKTARKHGKAGRRVKPHRSFTGSECPGQEIIDLVPVLDGEPIYAMPKAPLRVGDKGKAVLKLRRRMRRHGYKVKRTGRRYTKSLARHVVRFKRAKGGLGIKPPVTRKTWRALYRRPRG